jgi:hypothetical protein
VFKQWLSKTSSSQSAPAPAASTSAPAPRPEASTPPKSRLPETPASRGALFSSRVTRHPPPHRTHAPSGPPVRPRSLAPTEAAAVLRRHLHRYPVVTGEHAPYLRPPHPPSRVRQATAAPAAPPRPPLPAAGNMPLRSSPVPSNRSKLLPRI